MNTEKKVKKVSCISVWFPERNYGFIFGDKENPNGYFLHYTDIASGNPTTITKGCVVRFDAVPSRRGKGAAAANAEIFADRAEMEKADAMTIAAASLVALVGSTAPAIPTTDASAEVARG